MSLISCPECQHQISDKAASCPNCGAKIKRPSSIGKMLKWSMIFFITMAIFSGMIDNANHHSDQQADPKSFIRHYTPEQLKAAEVREKTAKALAKKQNDLNELDKVRIACGVFVGATLNDRDSAQFDDPETYYAVKHKDGTFRVQVRVRARNGFNALRYVTFDCFAKYKGTELIPLKIEQL